MSKYEHIHHHHLRNVAMMLEVVNGLLDNEIETLTITGQSAEGIKHLIEAKRSIEHAASLVDDGDHALVHNL